MCAYYFVDDDDDDGDDGDDGDGDDDDDVDDDVCFLLRGRRRKCLSQSSDPTKRFIALW